MINSSIKMLCCSYIMLVTIFRGLVKTLAQGLLNEHEVLTLSRKYKDKTQIPLSSIVNIVRDDLKRQKFTQFR